MMLKVSTKKINKQENQSVTVESVVQNRKTILRGKKPSCRKGSQTTTSSTISEVASTSKEKALLPFWNKYCEEKSAKLWLPTKTDCADLALNLCSGYAANLTQKSWYSTTIKCPLQKNLQGICCPSSLSSPVESMVYGSTVVRSRKIRLYPNKEQKQKLLSWLGCSRKYYNASVELFNNEAATSYVKDGELKKGFYCAATSRTKKALDDEETFQVWMMKELEEEWNKDIPYKVKQMPLEQAYKAGLMVNQRNKVWAKQKTNGDAAKLHFRQAKRDQGGIYVIGDNVALSKKDKWRLKVWSQQLGEIRFKDSKKTVELLRKGGASDGWITKESDNWFLNLPFNIATKSADKQGNIVALDPGVRTFMTAYDGNFVVNFAEQDFNRIVRLCRWADKLACSKSKDEQKKYHKLLFKIRNIVDEVHHKVANCLCRNYKTIILPTTNISKMVIRSGRKLRSKSVKSMLTWGIYRFSQFLEAKAKEYGAKVVRISEAYTSKTCGKCGNIHPTLGGNKQFKCPKCGTILDRDANGARNILLRAMLDSPDLQNTLQISSLPEVC